MRLARTPDGRRWEVDEEIAAPSERVWALLCDTQTWRDWGPTITAVDSPARFVEQGTEGDVRTLGGVWLPFEITACENHRWTWEVARVPATGHRVEETADGCRAVFELPLAAAPYAAVCRRALRRLDALATR